jgi:hypothetical protein
MIIAWEELGESLMIKCRSIMFQAGSLGEKSVTRN